MEQLREMIRAGMIDETAAGVKNLINKGFGAEAIMKQAMIPAMDEVGELFQKGEYYLPEMLVAGEAMKQGLAVLRPLLVNSGAESRGRVVLGTVQGDLHDIGKNIVAMTIEGAGFEVIDLGHDIPPEKFVLAMREHKPIALGLSTLLTTTMGAMGDTIEAINMAGVRDTVRIMIGGAAVQQDFADKIGADFYGPDSVSAMRYVRAVAREVELKRRNKGL
jgi:5-methyltetrahydrofolate--homocysteine methyltransferase